MLVFFFDLILISIFHFLIITNYIVVCKKVCKMGFYSSVFIYILLIIISKYVSFVFKVLHVYLFLSPLSGRCWVNSKEERGKKSQS